MTSITKSTPSPSTIKYWIVGLQSKYLLDTASFATIHDLKSLILRNEGIPIDQQRLMIGGRNVSDLSSCSAPSSSPDGMVTVQVGLSLDGGGKKKKGKKGKKDKKKGKKKKEEEVAAPDEFDFMNEDELSKIKSVLSEKLSTIQEERSYFQLERDFLQKMYDIVHEHEYAENVVNFKNMESDLEALQKKHRNNIRMYVQKVKHLDYDHQNTMNSISMEADMLQNEESTLHQHKKENLLKNKRILSAELLKTTKLNEAEIAQIERHFEDRQSAIHCEFEGKLTALNVDYEAILGDLKMDLDLQTKLQIHEIEERKNLHINDLIFNHEQSFNKMKEYYNSITRDNLDLIRSLKTELNELESKIKNHEAKYSDILSENKKLNLPLTKAKNEVLLYSKKLVNYSKDKRSLKSNQKHLLSLTNKLNVLQKQNSGLKARYRQLLHSKTTLLHRYCTINVPSGSAATSTPTATGTATGSSHSVNGALERKLADYQGQFRMKQKQLDAILKEANLDKVVISHLTNKLNTIIDHKNQQIEEKRFAVTKVHKMHDDLLRVYQAKIKELCPEVADHELFHIQNINHEKGATIPGNFITN